MIQLGEIDHIQITVADIPRAAAWYRDVLGFGDDGDWDDTSLYKHIKAGNVLITLGLPEHEPPHVAYALDRADFTHMREMLAGRGIPARLKTNKFADMLYFADPDGNTIEVFTWNDR